jgi:hypothetical protein
MNPQTPVMQWFFSAERPMAAPSTMGPKTDIRPFQMNICYF